MNNKIDFDSLAKSLLAQSPDILYKWLPSGKISGNEFQCGDLSGSAGKSLSINIRTGKWADFASDASGGDLISLYAAIKKISQYEAAVELGSNVSSIVQEKKTKEPDHIEYINAPAGTEPPKFHKKHSRSPDATWIYNLADGSIYGVVCRWNLPDGEKDIMPARYTGKGWRWKGFGEARPIYGIQELTKRPTAPVIIVEGEKAAEAAKKAIGAMVAVTWQGGSNAYSKSDWSVLKGRNVTIWPDADEPGLKAADGIAKILYNLGCKIKIVDVTGQPLGWDIADAVDEGINALVWAKPKVKEYTFKKDSSQQLLEPPEFTYIPDNIPDSTESGNLAPDEVFFRYLGYNNGNYYFYSLDAEQMIEASTASLMTAGTLLSLAPMVYWERMGMVSGNSTLACQSIGNMLIQNSKRVGVFDYNLCRGRGAWEDDGRAVLHLGDKLIVDGETMNISKLKTKYIYNKGLSSNVDFSSPLSAKEAYKLVEICRGVRWEDKIYGDLLAGWLMIAPICGSLTHRPHIYIIGPSKSGKSWVMEQLIAPILGRMAFVTSSKSTEAGIRQGMGLDALPVVFDESETESPKDKERLQAVFDLSRVSFGGDAAPIHKGTSDQQGMQFIPRSCFAFASINMSMTRYADETRTSVLKIKSASNDHVKEAENFEKLQRLTLETVTKEWRGGLLARSMALIGTIKKNHDTFAKVAGIHFGSRRQGDQLGAILAGLYALHTNRLVNEQEAKEFIQRHEWSQQKELTVDSSHSRMLDFLMQSEVKVDTEKGIKTRLIGELIDLVHHDKYDDLIKVSAATTELSRHGFKVKDNRLYVSNTHAWISERLKNSEWTSKWAHTLLNIPNSRASEKPERFGSLNARAVSIPVSYCLSISGDEHEEYPIGDQIQFTV